MIVYKILSGDCTTTEYPKRNIVEWKIGVTNHAKGKKDAKRAEGYFAVYEHELLAVLCAFGPWGVGRMFRCEAGGEIIRTGQATILCTELTPLEEIEMPQLTFEQRLAYEIYRVKEVYTDPSWNLWADKWLSGEDRTMKSAQKARIKAAKAEDAAEPEWITKKLVPAASARATASEARRLARGAKDMREWMATDSAENTNLVELAQKAMLIQPVALESPPKPEVTDDSYTPGKHNHRPLADIPAEEIQEMRRKAKELWAQREYLEDDDVEEEDLDETETRDWFEQSQQLARSLPLEWTSWGAGEGEKNET